MYHLNHSISIHQVLIQIVFRFTAKKLPKGEQGAGPGQGQGTRLTDREAPRAAANCCK